jgi:hypothetical protein
MSDINNLIGANLLKTAGKNFVFVEEVEKDAKISLYQQFLKPDLAFCVY